MDTVLEHAHPRKNEWVLFVFLLIFELSLVVMEGGVPERSAVICGIPLPPIWSGI